MHVAAYVEQLGRTHAKPHLAAIRMLFDWLVTGHVMHSNPAHVRGLLRVSSHQRHSAQLQHLRYSDNPR